MENKRKEIKTAMDMLDIISTWEFWLIITAVCVALELLTNTFAMFAMAGGSVAAIILSASGFGLTAQIVGLAVGSIVTFICFKPMMKKLLEITSGPEYVSNIDALVGKEVISNCDSDENGLSRVKIDGDNWQIRRENRDQIMKGERLVVTGYDSIVLIVENVKD